MATLNIYILRVCVFVCECVLSLSVIKKDIFLRAVRYYYAFCSVVVRAFVFVCVCVCVCGCVCVCVDVCVFVCNILQAFIISPSSTATTASMICPNTKVFH